MFPNPRRTAVLLSSFVILVFCISSFNNPVSAYNSTPSFSSPARIVKTYSSTAYSTSNWAGYAISAPIGSVTGVKGSWIQAAVTYPAKGVEDAVFWVGIDGFGTSTVEQTGTIAQCHNGVLSYGAWYEFYPSALVVISTLKIKITPGDKISASVKYSATTTNFTTTIKDVTTGKSFTKSAAAPGADRSSAEWIVEAPTLGSGLSALPNFGTASFGKDSTLVTGTNTATISGSTKVISKFGSMVDSITMVDNPSVTPIKAQPSALSTDGTSFSVAWVSAGP